MIHNASFDLNVATLGIAIKLAIGKVSVGLSNAVGQKSDFESNWSISCFMNWTRNITIAHFLVGQNNL